MISARHFGMHVIERYAPLGSALGADYREGVCAEGADFVCGPRPEEGGLYSCRPCNYPQLAVFKDLQAQINRIITSRKLPSSLLLKTDGRIGSKTATSLGKVVESVGAAAFPPDLQAAAMSAMNAPYAEQTYKEIAKVSPGMRDYLKAQANADGAPKNVPAPPSKPDTVTTGPATPEERILMPEAPKRGRLGYVVGGLAVVTAVGLVAAAAYQKRRR